MELVESIVKLSALNWMSTELEADNEKNASFGLAADIVSLSPDAIGVGAKKSKINSVDVPTVNWTNGLIPEMLFTVTGLIMHVVLSIPV